MKKEKKPKKAAERTYELLYIVGNQFTEDELKNIRQEINGLIAKYGGVIGYQEFLGKKKLAYPIKKNAHGYYVVTEFDLEQKDQLQPLMTELKLNQQIVRFQIIIRPKTTAENLRKAEETSYRAPLDEETEKTSETTVKEKTAKVSMDKLDEKLDEILGGDNIL